MKWRIITVYIMLIISILLIMVSKDIESLSKPFVVIEKRHVSRIACKYRSIGYGTKGEMLSYSFYGVCDSLKIGEKVPFVDIDNLQLIRK